MSKGSRQRANNQLAFYESFDRIFKQSDPRFCDAHDMRLVKDPKTDKMICTHCVQARLERNNGKS